MNLSLYKKLNRISPFFSDNLDMGRLKNTHEVEPHAHKQKPKI